MQVPWAQHSYHSTLSGSCCGCRNVSFPRETPSLEESICISQYLCSCKSTVKPDVIVKTSAFNASFANGRHVLVLSICISEVHQRGHEEEKNRSGLPAFVCLSPSLFLALCCFFLHLLKLKSFQRGLTCEHPLEDLISLSHTLLAGKLGISCRIFCRFGWDWYRVNEVQ